MIKALKFFLIQVLFFPSFCIKAGDPKIDSLLSVIKSAKEDTNLVATMNDLSWKYMVKGKNEEAIAYAEKALKLGEKLGYKYGAAVSYHNWATVFKRQGDFDKALEKDQIALKIMGEIGSKRGIANQY